MKKLQRLIPRDALLWLAQQPPDTVFVMDSRTECFLGRWLTAAAGRSIVCPQDTLFTEEAWLSGPGVPAPKWMTAFLSDLLQETQKRHIGYPRGAQNVLTAAQITPILRQAAFNWIPEASMRDMAAFMKTMEPDTKLDLARSSLCVVARFALWALALPDTEEYPRPLCTIDHIDWQPGPDAEFQIKALPGWMKDIQFPLEGTTILALRRRLGKLSRDPKYASEYHQL